ncbi:MAG: FAD binding domain-containing protein, partial [Zestosphaera sp.]
CNASPAADSAPPLLVHEAKAKLTSKQKTRTIKIEELITGPRKTALQSSELLCEVEVPYDEELTRAYSYIKLGRRNAFTLSVVSVAVAVKVVNERFKDVRVALNSVAPTPVRARSVESFLVGNAVRRERVEEASELVLKDIMPISDVRASAEYRRHVSKVLVRDALIRALRRSGWVGGG